MKNAAAIVLRILLHLPNSTSFKYIAELSNASAAQSRSVFLVEPLILHSYTNVPFTAKIDRIHRGHGIVDIGGQDVDIGPISRSDVDRTVEFIGNHEDIRYCIRPAWVHKMSSSGNALISTQSGNLNIGPISPDYIRDYVDVVPHANKAYCVTEEATDAAYPYHEYRRISNPLQAEWFPLSSNNPTIELEITATRGRTAYAEFGEYTLLGVEINIQDPDTFPSEGDIVSVSPRLDHLSTFPDTMEVDLVDIISGADAGSEKSATGSAATPSASGSTADSETERTTTEADDTLPGGTGVVHGSSDGVDDTSETKEAPEGGDGAAEASSGIHSDFDELRQRAEESAVEEVSTEVSTTTVQQYSRSSEIKAYVKARADGMCEGCGEPAPFTSKTGEPYLHAHHVHELSAGGSDTPDTVIALCPNCHHRVHHGEDGEEYNRELKRKLDDIEESSTSE